MECTSLFQWLLFGCLLSALARNHNSRFPTTLSPENLDIGTMGRSGVSFLLCILGAVALSIAAVYLRASTLHEREIKISVRAPPVPACGVFAAL